MAFDLARLNHYFLRVFPHEVSKKVKKLSARHFCLVIIGIAGLGKRFLQKAAKETKVFLNLKPYGEPWFISGFHVEGEQHYWADVTSDE